MIPLIPAFTILAKSLTAIMGSVGTTLIGDRVAKYLQERFPIFEKEYEKTKGKDRIIILQKELLSLKNLQIELLEDIIKKDYSKEEEEKLLKEFEEKTVFITELEKLLKNEK
jgi:hypothetical protein